MTQEQPPKPTTMEEEILWHHVRTKGVFRKKVIETLVVTDKRVIKELPQSGHLFTLLLSQIDSIQVLNQRRSSEGSMTMTGIRTQNLRTGQYTGKSRSNVIGTVLFISKDHQDISFDGIQDPVGLANLVKEAKKLFTDN